MALTVVALTCFLMNMAFICVTCGSQFPASAGPPPECPICQDPRQFVGLDGQQWTTLDELAHHHHNTIKQEEPWLYSIHTEPHFAIGERAFLIQTPQGNVLWDCVALLDQATIHRVRDLGGIAAIAISHPHYYTSMVEWSQEFDNAPIHLHSADRAWVMRPHANIQHWSGDSRKLLDDLVLVHTPGHFDGYQVLYWRKGADGQGVLLPGDQPQVCMDTRWVLHVQLSQLHSTRSKGDREIVTRLEPYKFDRIYGAFPKRTVVANAKEIVKRSAARFISAMGDQSLLHVSESGH